MKRAKPRPEDKARIAELSAELEAVANARREAEERDRQIGRELVKLGVSYYRLGKITGLTSWGSRVRYSTDEQT